MNVKLSIYLYYTFIKNKYFRFFYTFKPAFSYANLIMALNSIQNNIIFYSKYSHYNLLIILYPGKILH